MRVLAAWAAAMMLACTQPAPEPKPKPAAAPAPAPERIDVHVHLVGERVDELLATLDRHGLRAAVVLASPHLDPDHPPPPGADRFAGWRAANERLLEQTAGQRERLLPFVTIEPAELEAGELERWLERGACGVKIYAGHQSLHRRPLAAPEHEAAFALLEQRGVPVLLHVNTVRFLAELDALLHAYPKLEVVCPHLCGSRTDLDRLERILRAHPSLRVDTSHGPGRPGIDGFLNIEGERERLRALIHGEPQRFLFGSDLVTLVSGNELEASRLEWDQQIAANLGLLESERFKFWRMVEHSDSAEFGEYRGLALDGEVLEAVLAGNAKRWLRSCLK